MNDDDGDKNAGIRRLEVSLYLLLLLLLSLFILCSVCS